MESKNKKAPRRVSRNKNSMLTTLVDDFEDIETNMKGSFEKDNGLKDAPKLNTLPTPKYTEKSTTDKVPTIPRQNTEKNTDKTVIESRQRADNEPTKLPTKVRQNNDKIPAQTPTQTQTISRQNGDITEHNKVPYNRFSKLVGIQRKIIIFIYDCLKISREKHTNELTSSHISLSIEEKHDSVTRTMERMLKSGLLVRYDSKKGRGGWSKYEISEQLFLEIVQLETNNRLNRMPRQNTDIIMTQTPTQIPTAPSSSSSFNINNTTTTNEEGRNVDDIIFSDVLLGMGFNHGHKVQIIRDSTMPIDEIQLSLDSLSFDLEFDDMKKSLRSPISVIMKLLKNNSSYTSAKGYESEEDRIIRENTERTQAKNKERAEAKNKLINASFDEWVGEMSRNEIQNIVPPVGEPFSQLHMEMIKGYYRDNIFEGTEQERFPF
jgi:hypothetical protein